MSEPQHMNCLETAAQAMPSISLDELNDHAALQTRTDRKYIVTTEVATELVNWCAHATEDLGEVQVLEVAGRRSSHYDSSYYDTNDLLCYRMALQKNRRRFKVRLRTYVDTGYTFLEVKTKSASEQTVKQRIPWDPHMPIEEASEFIAAHLDDRLLAEGLVLEPSVRTVYQRTTLFLPKSLTRITLDHHLQWCEYETGVWLDAPDRVIIETKSARHASAVDHHLWEMGYRPLPSSKYASGIAVLHPSLPRQRWNRTISHYLQPRSLNASAEQERHVYAVVNS